MRKIYEVGRFASYLSHAEAERAAEAMACAGAEVEMQHLVVSRNNPGCLPEFVSRISRLDILFD